MRASSVPSFDDETLDVYTLGCMDRFQIAVQYFSVFHLLFFLI